MWLVALIACGSPPSPAELPEDGERVHVGALSFDSWPDVIALQAGADRECRFIDPRVDDATTAFPPLQSFWVIHDPDLDEPVLPGFSDVFFEGDAVAPDDFPERDRQDPLGFQAISGFGRSLLPLEQMDVDGRYLNASLAGSIGAELAVELVPTDTGCAPIVEACLWPCEDGVVEISEIYLELGTWGVESAELVP